MREKLKALDRNIIALVVIAVLVIVGLVVTGSGDNANPEEVASAQESSEHVDDGHEHAEGEEHDEAEEKPAEAETVETEVSEEPEVPAEADSEATEASSDESEANEEEDEAPASGPYTYEAQPGDSYTEMARKAVQTYGILNNVNMSQAQIVFAETTLTKAAQATELEVGESVSFGEDVLRGVVDQARDLDEATEANWATYVQFVDFNTDAIGEAA